MRSEDIVEGLNQQLKREREEKFKNVKGLFVLQRNVDINESFKVYKTFTATLWYVQNKKKYMIFQEVVTGRYLTGEEEKALRELNIKLIQGVLTFSKTEQWELIKRGEYGIPHNE